MTRFFGGAGSGCCLARDVRAGRSAAAAEGFRGCGCGRVIGILIPGNVFGRWLAVKRFIRLSFTILINRNSTVNSSLPLEDAI